MRYSFYGGYSIEHFYSLTFIKSTNAGKHYTAMIKNRAAVNPFPISSNHTPEAD